MSEKGSSSSTEDILTGVKTAGDETRVLLGTTGSRSSLLSRNTGPGLAQLKHLHAKARQNRKVLTKQ